MVRQLVLDDDVFKDGHEDRYAGDQLDLSEQQQRHHDVCLVLAMRESRLDERDAEGETLLTEGCHITGIGIR